MNADQPRITLWHRSNAKHSRWRLIGTADGYAAAISLGERAGLVGGKWWLDDRDQASQEITHDDHDDKAKNAA